MQKRIVSGIQPTGVGLTLGNYLGAVKPWVDTQHESENLFMIVDSHAITVPQDPKELHRSTLELLATYMAAGIDTEKNTVFVQSHVPAHMELGWILSCLTPMGWLKRMTQFKDKSGKNTDTVGTGLFTYPSLMAADILLYHATHVPVGDDQKQHVELTRDLAISFNHKFGDVFTVPEPVIPKVGARIMSLRDGSKKMSKSDPSDMSRINLSDSAEVISDKIKRAKTDTGVMPSVGEDYKERLEVKNLIDIYALLSGNTPDQVVAEYDGQPFSPFKTALGEVLVEKITPIGACVTELLGDKAELLRLMAKGRDRAISLGQPTLDKVKEVMGFVANP
jgi:tryptophanyl-tRNA synthetase